MPQAQARGQRCRKDEHEYAGRISSCLAIDAGAKHQGHGKVDNKEHHHQRTGLLDPLRSHAEPGQIARDQMQEPSHRGSAGEPQNQDGADVVERPKTVAQILMCQVGQGASAGRAALAVDRLGYQDVVTRVEVSR